MASYVRSLRFLVTAADLEQSPDAAADAQLVYDGPVARVLPLVGMVTDRQAGGVPQPVLHGARGRPDGGEDRRRGWEDRPAVDDHITDGREPADDLRQLGEIPIRAATPVLGRLEDLVERRDASPIGEHGGVRREAQRRLQLVERVAVSDDLPRSRPTGPRQRIGDLVDLELAQARALALDQFLHELQHVLQARDMLPGIADRLEPSQDRQVRRARVVERGTGPGTAGEELLAEPGEIGDIMTPGLVGERRGSSDSATVVAPDRARTRAIV